MGRLGLWTHGAREIRTPNVAFVEAEGFPAPRWAEILATRDGGGPRNVSIGVGGSFFLPRPRGGGGSPSGPARGPPRGGSGNPPPSSPGAPAPRSPPRPPARRG